VIDVYEQTLPERYNAKTELSCEVPSADGKYDFVLE
jgi:hypothetical protein